MTKMKILKIERLENKFFTLDEIKAYLRVEHRHDDAMISNLIDSAIEYAEKFCKMDLYPQIYHCETGEFYGKEFTIKHRPISSVTDVIITNHAGFVKHCTEFKEYFFDIISKKIILENYERVKKIEFKLSVGFNEKMQLPSQLKTAMKQHVQQLYDHKDGMMINLSAINQIYRIFRLPRLI